MLLPIILISAGAAAIAAVLISSIDKNRDVPQHDPDVPAVPGHTGYKKVDAILDKLKAAASSSGIPLGLIIGWICKESSGNLNEVTKLNERGLFQLMASESASLIDPTTGRMGLDHNRLSTDLDYSINAGLLLIGHYMTLVDKLELSAVATRNSTYFWKIVKLFHTIGSGAATKLINGAKQYGRAGSWEDLENFALNDDNSTKFYPRNKSQKWFKFMDQLYAIGKPFGFGSDSPAVAGEFPWIGADGVLIGGQIYSDIIDPLDALK